jgi:sRNA-binding carbon storage regulator CsrA
VRLGITAPKEIVVDRSEVHRRKVAEYTLDASRASSKRENAARPADSAADATS